MEKLTSKLLFLKPRSKCSLNNKLNIDNEVIISLLEHIISIKNQNEITQNLQKMKKDATLSPII